MREGEWGGGTIQSRGFRRYLVGVIHNDGSVSIVGSGVPVTNEDACKLATSRGATYPDARIVLLEVSVELVSSPQFKTFGGV